jgi:putative glycosyltransferase
MKLSIVATLYQSAPYIEEFYGRARLVAKHLAAEDYEIILVNDGSPDNSLDLAVSLTESDSAVTIIDLSRNFGHHKAMMTGLMHSKGELVFLIDSDLEEEPEWLLQFSHQMKKQGCDVIYGVQTRRKGRKFERWSGILFYRLFNMLSGLHLPESLVTARLMTRRYVNALMLHQEREILIAGLWQITGFAQYPHAVTKRCRSKTTYSFQKKVSHLVNSVTSFSNAPLVVIFYAGITISLFAAIYTSYLIFHWLFLATPLSGWTSVMASIWLLGGMIISFLGVVGIYIAKVFTETKRRPYTIVRHIYGR